MKTLMIGAVFVCAGAAQGGILTASFTRQYNESVRVRVNGDERTLQTTHFNWTRSDSPGPGVDPLVPELFNTYCIEINEHVSAATTYTFNVITPAAAGLSATQEMLIGRLWASFFASVNTDVESAAFQMAQWEIMFDGTANLSGGGFRGLGSSSVVEKAGDYLDAITAANYSGGQTQMVVLQADGVQDQITPIPAPGAAALAVLGGLVALRRRR